MEFVKNLPVTKNLNFTTQSNSLKLYPRGSQIEKRSRISMYPTHNGVRRRSNKMTLIIIFPADFHLDKNQETKVCLQVGGFDGKKTHSS